jgi:hypothetical protein
MTTEPQTLEDGAIALSDTQSCPLCRRSMGVEEDTQVVIANGCWFLVHAGCLAARRGSAEEGGAQ